MNQNDDAGVEREQISLSAVYHQLDDHLGSDEAPYDVGAGLERLMTWMSDDAPSTQRSRELLPSERPETASLSEAELLRIRLEAVERTARRRRVSLLTTLCTVVVFSILACVGLLYGLPHIAAHAVVPVAVTVGVVDALLVGAVAYLHVATTSALRDDLQSALGTVDRPYGNVDRRRREADKSGVADVPKTPSSVRARGRTMPSLLTDTAHYAIESYSRTFRLVLVIASTAIPLGALAGLLHYWRRLHQEKQFRRSAER